MNMMRKRIFTVSFKAKAKTLMFFLFVFSSLLCGQPIHFLSDSAVISPASRGTMCGFGRPRLETVTSLLGDVRGSLWSWYWVLFVRLLSVHKQQRITDSRAPVLHDHTAVVSQICVSLCVCPAVTVCMFFVNFSNLKG